MSRIIGLQNNFTSGEIDPKIGARVDLQQYYNALETAQNVVIQPQGGIKKRPGTKYISELTYEIRHLVNKYDSDFASLKGTGDYVFSHDITMGRSIWFKPDGTKMYTTVISDNQWNHEYDDSSSLSARIVEFDLPIAWDITGAVYSGVSPSSVTTDGTFNLSADGKYLFAIDHKVIELRAYSLSTAFDITTASITYTLTGQAAAVPGISSSLEHLHTIEFSDDGTKAIAFVGRSTSYASASVLISFTLSSAWDMSTASPTGSASYSDYYTISRVTEPTGYYPGQGHMKVVKEGTRIYTGGESYELKTAWKTNRIGGVAQVSKGPTENIFSPGKQNYMPFVDDLNPMRDKSTQYFYVPEDESRLLFVNSPQYDFSLPPNYPTSIYEYHPVYSDWKMIPFEFSVDDSYMIVVGPGKMFVVKDGELVTNINNTGQPYLVLSAVQSRFADEINFTQAADSLIFVHQDMPPQFVQRGAADNLWTVTPLEFDYIPQYPFAYDTHNPTFTITPSGVSGNITITASSVTTDTGTAQAGSSNTITLKAASAYGSDDQPNGMFIKLNSGTGAGQTRHVEDYVASTKVLTVYPAWDIAPDATTQYEVKAFEEAAVGEYISALNGFGRARITEFVSATQVKAYVEIPFFDTDAITTGNWESEHGWEDAWSDTRGWPRSTVFHEGRLFFGGSKQRPSTLWGSRVSDFFNFDPGENLDDAALEATLDTGRFNAIVDLYSGRNLQVFTTGGEFYIPQSLGDPITPSTLSVQEQTSNGCKTNVPVVNIDGSTLFIQRGGKTLSEFLYDDAVAGYASTRISLLCSHLLKNPSSLTSRKATSTDEGDRILIANRDDGSIACFTLLKTEKIVAPSEWVTELGEFREVGVDVTDTYCIVKRVKDDLPRFYIEQFREDIFTDCSSIVNPEDLIFDTFSVDVSQLQNLGSGIKKVGIIDGSVITNNEAFYINGADNSLSSQPVDRWTAGLPINSTIKTLPYEGRLQSGSIRTFKKRILEITADIYETSSITIDGTPIKFATGESQNSDMEAAGFTVPVAENGFKTKISVLGYTKDASITITDSSPLPMNILSLDYKVSTGQ